MELLDLGAHLHPELGVQVGEGLVEQKDLGIADYGPTHRHPLSLAAGKLSRLAVEQALDAEDACRLVHAPSDLCFRVAAIDEAEGDIVEYREMRVERVVLEDHRDVAVLGLELVDPTAADADLAGADLLEPRDHPESGRFAAARRPDQNDELLVGDAEIDAGNRHDLPESLGEPAQLDRRHSCPPGPRAA